MFCLVIIVTLLHMVRVLLLSLGDLFYIISAQSDVPAQVYKIENQPAWDVSHISTCCSSGRCTNVCLVRVIYWLHIWYL